MLTLELTDREAAVLRALVRKDKNDWERVTIHNTNRTCCLEALSNLLAKLRQPVDAGEGLSDET